MLTNIALLHFNDSRNIGKNEYGDAWTGNSTLVLDKSKFGKGCLLNANYSHLDGPSVQFNDKMTVSFWAMAASTSAKLYYAYNNINKISFPAQISLYSEPGESSIHCFFSSNGTTYDFNTIVIPTITLNEWHHIALVVNSNVVYVFLDGVKTFEHTYTSNITIPYTAGAYDSIGSYKYFNTRPGTLYTDEFKLSRDAEWTSDFVPPTTQWKTDKSAYNDPKNLLWGSV